MRKLALKRIAGNRTTSAAGATEWFTVPGVRWAWQSDEWRDRQLEDLAHRFADLAGRRIEIRGTSVPWSAAGWRAKMDGAAIDPHPDRAALLDSQAAHLEGMEFADKQLMIGVRLDTSNPLTARARARLERVLDTTEKSPGDGHGVEIDDIGRTMAAAGLNAHPSTQRDVEWMVRRSVALGCPPPVDLPSAGGPWEETDIDELADTAEWTMIEPFAPTVRVQARLGDGRQVVRHVCVLTVGHTDEFDKRGAWLSRCDKLPFPVEFKATVDVLEKGVVEKLIRDAINKVKYQIEHHREHKLDPPLSLAQAGQKAKQVENEIEQGLDGLETRVHCWVRFAVSGETEREAVDRAGQVIRLFKKAKINVVRPKDQYTMAKEFIAEEQLSSSAYQRQMPVVTLAGGMPQAHHNLGHRTGMYLGFTAVGARRPVLMDMHRSTEEREESGTTFIGGNLGAGKSALMFKMAYLLAMDGVPTSIIDWSGPLAALCDLPELRAVSRHIDLLSARPGFLNPFRVIPDPRRDDYGTDKAWQQALGGAQAERKRLCRDIIMMFLPADMSSDDTRLAIVGAMKNMTGATTDTPLQVIGNLDASREKRPKLLAEYLRQISHLPAARLVFPFGGAGDYDGSQDDALLTVITGRDLALPPAEKPRADWTEEQSMSAALLHLAAWQTYRSVYRLPRAARKAIMVDEAYQLTRVDSGVDLLTTVAAETRKRNIRFVLAAHTLESLYLPLLMDKVDSVFLGRTKELRAQQAGLRVLGAPVGAGFEEAVGGLSPYARDSVGRSGVREFVHSDGEGGLDKMVVDLTDLPAHVRAGADTTARPRASGPVRAVA